jgi:hypothetical protein
MLDLDILEGADNTPLYDIRRNLGVEGDDTSNDKRIAAMSVEVALERYLTWNGIIGYSRDILSAVDALRAAEIQTEGESE